jgi:hypothetical protein
MLWRGTSIRDAVLLRLFVFESGWETDRVKLKDGEVSAFCPDWAAQKADGRSGYRLQADSFPDSMTASARYEILRYPNT